MRAKLLFGLMLVAANATLGAERDTPRSLRAAATGLFTSGVGIHDRISERPADWPLLFAQFSAVTPENCLKPDPVQVTEGKFNFARADAFVAFAASNNLQVVAIASCGPRTIALHRGSSATSQTPPAATCCSRA
jgi:endo-1,4-beta-xylanase